MSAVHMKASGNQRSYGGRASRSAADTGRVRSNAPRDWSCVTCKLCLKARPEPAPAFGPNVQFSRRDVAMLGGDPSL